MPSVRIAGLVSSQSRASIQKMSAIMEVQAWIHRVSTHGPTEDWDTTQA